MRSTSILLLLVAGCAWSSLSEQAESVPPEMLPPPVDQAAAPESDRQPVAGREENLEVDVRKLIARADPDRGAVLYGRHCSPCHGPAGEGDGPAAGTLRVRPRNLTATAYMRHLPPERLYQVIREGGPSIGRDTAMPGFGGILGDAEIGAILAHVRHLAGTDGPAPWAAPSLSP